MSNIVRSCIMIALVSVHGFAATRNSADVVLSAPVTVNSSGLFAGDYKVFWTGPGPEVQVSFKRGSKVVLTTPGLLTPSNNEAELGHREHPYEIKTAQKGKTTVLLTIQFTHVTLSFDNKAGGPL
jgi:hypothetical protein